MNSRNLRTNSERRYHDLNGMNRARRGIFFLFRIRPYLYREDKKVRKYVARRQRNATQPILR